MAVLSAEHLYYNIGSKNILSDISMELTPGEVLAVVGQNGAGKSTLLKLLAGDLAPDSGSIYLDKRPFSEYKPRDLAKLRAVMPQSNLMSLDFTVYEVVTLGRHPHIRRGETYEDHRIVEKCLERTEVEHLRDRLYPTLSGGEQARVTMARILAQQTPILLLDEPTGSLDLRHQHLVMQITRELAAQGAAVLAILHDLNLASVYADRITMLHKGQLVTSGTPGEVLTAETIEQVFELPVQIVNHPTENCPLIIPVSG